MLETCTKNLAVLGIYVVVRPIVWIISKWDKQLY